MAITNKKPPIKETVGALYYCFNTEDESGEWTNTFDEAVTKSNVVKNVSVTENGDSTNVYASGETYDTISDVSSIDNEVEVVAFNASDLYKMRGDTVSENGLVLSGAPSDRPFFAYGKVVKLRGGNFRYEWYPKCKLTENTDDVATKEESFSEQTDKVTIRAYPFDESGNIKVMVDSTATKIPATLTEEKFFAKPILTSADLTTAIGA